MRFWVGFVAAPLLAAIGGLAALAWGALPVAATTPHTALTRWVLSTAMERGVARRAGDAPVPDDLGEAARIRKGAAHYDAMCVGCHGAPGVEAGEMAHGLLPEPPELVRHADDWSPAELFWIVKHGVRMTGMAAFGPSHSDRELWDLVAFLRKLPALSPDAYHALADQGSHDHGHEHGAAPGHEH